ncbi:MAG: N-acetyl-gamma-glutamyl-phosphate reductase [Bacteroidales bacterium]|jgi:N-acetyl-gamma-glutamyl-phosphate reductase|nr:N-acetyl-gamma-glutamyl-phosphate reductase [Bacteroidales bacterium]
MKLKRVGIVGASGYTGSELTRILAQHPQVEICAITSESHSGKAFSDLHPFFRGIVDQKLITADEISGMELDLVFLALPHGVSMEYVQKFEHESFRIIDLSGDYRLNDPETYEQWYGKIHSFTEAFEGAVYGLPELFADQIKNAQLVANPGCFPTSAILPLAPLVSAGLIDSKGIIIDSKTAVSGAGIKPKEANLFSNVNDNFKAYGLKKHRHTIEMKQILDRFSDEGNSLQFTPHLLPVDRGILSTIYVQPKSNIELAPLRQLYQNFYGNKPFVRLCENPPAVKDVRASNYCDIFVDYDPLTNNIILISVIDNLVKGAAGQAVQNMNIMFGFDERQGLSHIPIHP